MKAQHAHSGFHFNDELQRIVEARHHDPFTVLGRHAVGNKWLVRAFLPGARDARILPSNTALARIPGTDLFECMCSETEAPRHYQIAWTTSQGDTVVQHDAYSFPPQIPNYDLHLFGQGKHHHAYRFLGAHPKIVDGVAGVVFATWAPNAERVSVVGDFNQWDGRIHSMRSRGGCGVWEIFIPDLPAGTLYKFELRNRENGMILAKADPYGQQFEKRPNTASIVAKTTEYPWEDSEWLAQRAKFEWLHEAVSIYEVHLGSWQRADSGEFLSYRELAHRLVPYVLDLGFTHIELLPVSEHPLDASWGYQTVGNYAPTSRFGDPDEFRYFVDYCHRHGVGVFIDWVPGHFPKDAHGLARFDGSALYEHEDPRRGEHRDWGTLIYNYGRNEVRNYLLSSAVYWMEEFHVDGLRVDAVASVLYLDYSREPGDWIPNEHGGNENLEAIEFLRELNTVTHELFPGSLVMAEESTSWPMVSRPTWLGGLGFSMKWNMGWMNDTLAFMGQDPIHRQYHHDMLTFSQIYAYTENFILPFSHDEVVHGKRSLLNRMPGDEWQRFANLRLLYTYMYTHPGKKLLFMGCEFGQGTEWNEATTLDWYVLQYPLHQGVKQLVKDLNRVYREERALHRLDFDQSGFRWIDCHDATQSVLSYQRLDERGDPIVVVLNFTPVPRHGYRIGVPRGGAYRELLNSDSSYYAGSNVGNDIVYAEPVPWMNQSQSIALTLPPLGALILKPC